MHAAAYAAILGLAIDSPRDGLGFRLVVAMPWVIALATDTLTCLDKVAEDGTRLDEGRCFCCCLGLVLREGMTEVVVSCNGCVFAVLALLGREPDLRVMCRSPAYTLFQRKGG